MFSFLNLKLLLQLPLATAPFWKTWPSEMERFLICCGPRWAELLWMWLALFLNKYRLERTTPVPSTRQTQYTGDQSRQTSLLLACWVILYLLLHESFCTCLSQSWIQIWKWTIWWSATITAVNITIITCYGAALWVMASFRQSPSLYIFWSTFVNQFDVGSAVKWWLGQKTSTGNSDSLISFSITDSTGFHQTGNVTKE